MRFLSLVALAVLPSLFSTAAPAPKEGPPRVLVVSGNKDGNSNIYLVQAGTGEVKRLTDDKAAYTDPVWAPDGSRIAFVSYNREGSRDIWTMKPDGTDQVQLTKKHGIGAFPQPQWSPDGSRIAFVSNNAGSHICTVEVATGKVSQLTETFGWPNAQQASHPVWAPDGKRLTYTLSKWKLGSSEPSDWSAYVVNADGTGTRRLGDRGASGGWAPDGKRVACLSLGGVPEDSYAYTIGADGKGKVRLTAARDGPWWSPDGNKLCLFDNVDGADRVVVVNADGSGRCVVTPEHWGRFPRWSPDGKSLSYLRREKENDKAALVVSDPDGKNAKELLEDVSSPGEWKPK